jgi:hypothetical protein
MFEKCMTYLCIQHWEKKVNSLSIPQVIHSIHSQKNSHGLVEGIISIDDIDARGHTDLMARSHGRVGDLWVIEIVDDRVRQCEVSLARRGLDLSRLWCDESAQISHAILKRNNER